MSLFLAAYRQEIAFSIDVADPDVRSPNDFGATNDPRLIGIPVREILSSKASG